MKNKHSAKDKSGNNSRNTKPKIFFLLAAVLLALTVIVYAYAPEEYVQADYAQKVAEVVKEQAPKLDTELYDRKLIELANMPVIVVATSSATSTVTSAAKAPLWPVKTVYPNVGALLPFNRIVAYYGNFYSTKMGILGEFSEDVVLAKLDDQVREWELADPGTPVIPAIHYIASTAQTLPGKDGKYTLRMPDDQIQKAIDMAKKSDAIVFLDLQIGGSTVPKEIEYIKHFLVLPQVHLGLDPEFAMKNGAQPGTVIGTMDAAEINQAAEILAQIVRDNNLPPKILIIHRFTQRMVTNYQDIKPLPEVQIVIEMDGWGSPARKIATHKAVIYPEPVQFTGFKIFYKNDLKAPSERLMTPQDLLKLTPRPSYIQYQ